MGVVCHTGFHFSESDIELDGVGVEDELDKAKVKIVEVEGEFMVAGVKGTLENAVDVSGFEKLANLCPRIKLAM